MMDDGFQFLDFGSSNSPDYLCWAIRAELYDSRRK
jgi:hypothetical protein